MRWISIAYLVEKGKSNDYNRLFSAWDSGDGTAGQDGDVMKWLIVSISYHRKCKFAPLKASEMSSWEGGRGLQRVRFFARKVENRRRGSVCHRLRCGAPAECSVAASQYHYPPLRARTRPTEDRKMHGMTHCPKGTVGQPFRSCRYSVVWGNSFPHRNQSLQVRPSSLGASVREMSSL